MLANVSPWDRSSKDLPKVSFYEVDFVRCDRVSPAILNSLVKYVFFQRKVEFGLFRIVKY